MENGWYISVPQASIGWCNFHGKSQSKMDKKNGGWLWKPPHEINMEWWSYHRHGIDGRKSVIFQQRYGVGCQQGGFNHQNCWVWLAKMMNQSAKSGIPPKWKRCGLMINHPKLWFEWILWFTGKCDFCR